MNYKKWGYFLLSFTLICFVFAANQYPEDNPLNAATYLPFDDTSGEIYAPGYVNGALLLNKDLTKPMAIDTQWSVSKNAAMSMSMWIKVEEPLEKQPPIFWRTSDSENYFFGIGFYPGYSVNGSYQIGFKAGANNNDEDQSSWTWTGAGDLLNDGKWHHLVLNKRAGSGYYHTKTSDVDLYIDGLNWTRRHTKRENAHSTGTFGSMYIGWHGNTNAKIIDAGNHYLTAVIDEVIIFNRNLSTEEVSVLYNTDYSNIKEGKTSNVSSIQDAFKDRIIWNLASENVDKTQQQVAKEVKEDIDQSDKSDKNGWWAVGIFLLVVIIFVLFKQQNFTRLW